MRAEIGLSEADRVVLDHDVAPPPAPPPRRKRKLDSFDLAVFWIFAAISMWVVFVDLWQVVVNGRVYTFGAEGLLSALDLATGRRIWSEDTKRRFGVSKGFFGAAGSPLVEDGRLIANIGGVDGVKGAGIQPGFKHSAKFGRIAEPGGR